jgi:PAS domain S-box-containing protein
MVDLNSARWVNRDNEVSGHLPVLIALFLVYLVCVAFAVGLYVFQDIEPPFGIRPSAALLSALGASILVSLALALMAFNRHRAWLTLREDERSFRELYENISEGVFRSTLDGRMISANPSLVRLNGYATEAELIKGCNDIAKEWYVNPNRRAEINEMVLEKGRIAGIVSEVYRHHTRERIWIEESVRLVRHKKTGAPLYYDGTLREVTETMRRLELQDRYNKIASIVSACLYQHRATPDGRKSMPYASIGLYHIFGVRPEEVVEDAACLAARIHPDDLERIAASLKHSSETLTVWQCEYRVCLPDGTLKWARKPRSMSSPISTL